MSLDNTFTKAKNRKINTKIIQNRIQIKKLKKDGNVHFL